MSKNTIVIGAGILGLSVAEHLSAQGISITLIAPPPPTDNQVDNLPGSYSAAAHVSVRGQQFAREPGFALKLAGRKAWPAWNARWNPNEILYCEGCGWEELPSQELADIHMKRVCQDPHLVLSHGGSVGLGVQRTSLTRFSYPNELIVFARKTLCALERVVSARPNVTRVYAHVSNAEFQHLTKSHEVVILCAGLSSLDILVGALPPAYGQTVFAKQLRTTGVTCTHPIPFSRVCEQLDVDPVTTTVFTWHDLDHRFILSKHENPAYTYVVHRSTLQGIPAGLHLPPPTARWGGERIGFGRKRDLVCEGWETPSGCSVVVCTGAHRSGFAYAPVVSELVLRHF